MAKFDWYNDTSKEFLDRGYLNNKTIYERIDDISNTVYHVFNDPEIKDKVKEYIELGYYVLPSPVWANVGTNKAAGISCFNSYIEDSIKSILHTAAEVGMLCKIGGGTSAYFGSIRPAGSNISVGGTTYGAVHFMKIFDVIKNTISQGSTRRGEFAAYLDISHGDIEEFLRINQEGHPLQRFPFGVCVSDEWLNSMKNGDAQKRKIWASVLEARCKTGFPYIMFSDTVNNNTVDVYKDKGMRIYSSNMCVTADQLVVTNKGLKTVIDLYNSKENLILFDGDKQVSASPMRLIEKNVPVFRITTKEGRSHTVTDYHKVMTDKGMIECKYLKKGDKIKIQRKEGLFGNVHCPERAFLYGMYLGDGTQTNDEIHIDIWENDFDLQEHIKNCLETVYKQENWISDSRNLPNFKVQNTGYSTVKKMRISSSKLKQFGFNKDYIPQWILEGDKETQAAFLQGIYFTDGTASLTKGKWNNPICLSLTSIRTNILNTIQIMLSNFGISSKIYKQAEASYKSLPDGKGGYKEYFCKSSKRLNITNKNDAIKFNNITNFLDRKGVVLEKTQYRDNSQKYDTIIDISYIGNEDVYCTTVNSLEHAWVCNSFITSNCSEILLPTNSEETFVCDLIGMNLTKYDEWKNTDAVRIAAYIADAVLEEFIQLYEKEDLIKRSINFAKRHRALGIGASGYHSLLQSKMIAFESMEAKFLNLEIFKNIQTNAWKASKELAERYGAPELLRDYGRRNTTLTAIAPNTSSSMIMGQHSQSIEPYTANYYIKKSAKKKLSVKNPYLEKVLDNKNHNTMDVWESILIKGGSVQHLPFLSEQEKKIFRTFGEISQKEILIQSSQRQKYIDQGQSLNLMIHPNTPIKDINKLMLEAHEMGIKTLYYQLSTNAAQEFIRDILSCDNCAG